MIYCDVAEAPVLTRTYAQVGYCTQDHQRDGHVAMIAFYFLLDYFPPFLLLLSTSLSHSLAPCSSPCHQYVLELSLQEESFRRASGSLVAAAAFDLSCRVTGGRGWVRGGSVRERKREKSGRVEEWKSGRVEEWKR